jgi:hypothetical protein
MAETLWDISVPDLVLRRPRNEKGRRYKTVFERAFVHRRIGVLRTAKPRSFTPRGTEIRVISSGTRRHLAADADIYGMGKARSLSIIQRGTEIAARDPNKYLVASLEA